MNWHDMIAGRTVLGSAERELRKLWPERPSCNLYLT